MIDTTLMIFIVVSMLVLGIVGVVFILKLDRQSRSRARSGGSMKSTFPSIPQYLKMSKFLGDHFLTRGGYIQIEEQVAMLAVYTPTEIRVEATKFYLLSTVSMVGVVLAGALLFRQLFTTLLIATFAMVIRTVIVDKQIDKIHYRVLKEMSVALSSIRQNYLRTGLIPEAIQECEKGALLGKPLDDIYNILTMTGAEQKLDEFNATIPFKLLQTLAGVAYYINEVGDSKESESSTSDFVNALGMIADEVNLEIRKIAQQKAKFGSLEWLPIAPLPFIAIVEMYFSGIIPGTSIIYNGLLGYVSRITIVMLGIIGYSTITKINKAVSVRPDDRQRWVQNVLNIELISDWVSTIRPKRLDKIRRIRAILKGALSQKTDKDLIVEGIVYSALTFVVGIIVVFVSLNLSREFIYNNVGSLSLMSSENLTEEDILERKEMDAEFLALPEEPSKAWTDEFIRRKLPNMMDFDRAEQSHRILTKYRSYYNTVFKWWMILIVYAFCALASFAPNIQLRWRRWLLTTETEEDVLQMQTIIAILMNTPIDTLDTLEWLARQSKLHKAVLTEAFHEYPSDPELALGRLKSSSSSAEFSRICDKLMLTIHQISLKEAFSDLVSERAHVLRIREITQEATLARKRSVAGMLSLAPLAALAVLHLLAPIGILGFRELSEAMSNVSF